MKKILFLSAGVIILLGLMGVNCDGTFDNSGSANSDTANATEPAAATTDSENTGYFSDDAKVMFFYSDGCGWCSKQKAVLAELAAEGYVVKPMDVGKNQNYWQDYQVEGTPTFIAPDGTKLVGFQDKGTIKAFLDKYK